MMKIEKSESCFQLVNVKHGLAKYLIVGLLRQAFVGDVGLGNTEKILYGIMKDGVDVKDVDIVGRIFVVFRIIGGPMGQVIAPFGYKSPLGTELALHMRPMEPTEESRVTRIFQRLMRPVLCFTPDRQGSNNIKTPRYYTRGTAANSDKKLTNSELVNVPSISRASSENIHQSPTQIRKRVTFHSKVRVKFIKPKEELDKNRRWYSQSEIEMMRAKEYNIRVATRLKRQSRSKRMGTKTITLEDILAQSVMLEAIDNTEK